MNRRTACSPYHQHGVGLIEVLVSVLVLSIGLLGIAWVQTRALSSNNSSMARSMAVVASYSILDALRADRVNATAYNGTVTTNACPDPGTLVQTQLSNWCNELAAALGAVANTTGEVTCAADGECTITITYDDSRIGAGGNATQTVVTKGML
ncbi:MAG TPA: type IV pilus modification protein PilV [Gammaproteobacteria bacterium]|nr:type IV pilus modification protein PilV [Gammaproteobacteria bacterium]